MQTPLEGATEAPDQTTVFRLWKLVHRSQGRIRVFEARWWSFCVTLIWLANFVCAILFGMFGLLGVAGGLADVSDHENRVLGGTLLCVAAATAINVVALPQAGLWRSRLRWGVYIVNTALLVFGAVGWWQLCREHRLFLPPPTGSLILFAIGLLSLGGLLLQSRDSGKTGDQGQSGEGVRKAGTRSGDEDGNE